MFLFVCNPPTLYHSDDESNQEIEKRMGEVDGKEKDNGGEELDRNMWAPEEEAEEEEREVRGVCMNYEVTLCIFFR